MVLYMARMCTGTAEFGFSPRRLSGCPGMFIYNALPAPPTNRRGGSRRATSHFANRGKISGDVLIFECETRWGIPQLIKRARKRAGVEHYRPHQVGRHAFATRLLNAGKSTAAVKQAGGWKSESRAFDEYYSHLAREVTDQAVASMKLDVTQNATQNINEAEKPNKSVA